ncbi:condensation domain-containing protein, partial [Bacillus sp. DHT2]
MKFKNELHTKGISYDMKSLKYWLKKLSGDLPVLQLPTDYERPLVQTYTGGRVTYRLGKDLLKDLYKLSQQEGVTLYMTLLASFKVLLYRYTGQEDILVGSPVANRNHRELEELIGFFVNTLVMRSDLSGNPSFKEFLGR